MSRPSTNPQHPSNDDAPDLTEIAGTDYEIEDFLAFDPDQDATAFQPDTLGTP